MKSAAISKLEITNPTDPLSRIIELVEKRTAAASEAGEEEKKAFPHKTNGDEELYADQAYAGNFSKTLPHDPNTGWWSRSLIRPCSMQCRRALWHPLISFPVEAQAN
jgi:hypothetical protein